MHLWSTFYIIIPLYVLNFAKYYGYGRKRNETIGSKLNPQTCQTKKSKTRQSSKRRTTSRRAPRHIRRPPPPPAVQGARGRRRPPKRRVSSAHCPLHPHMRHPPCAKNRVVSAALRVRAASVHGAHAATHTTLAPRYTDVLRLAWPKQSHRWRYITILSR